MTGVQTHCQFSTLTTTPQEFPILNSNRKEVNQLMAMLDYKNISLKSNDIQKKHSNTYLDFQNYNKNHCNTINKNNVVYTLM